MLLPWCKNSTHSKTKFKSRQNYNLVDLFKQANFNSLEFRSLLENEEKEIPLLAKI